MRILALFAVLAAWLGGCEPVGTGDCPEGQQEWYPDQDGDGYGRSGPPVCSAEDEVEGHSRLSGDCLDNADGLEPGQTVVGLPDGYRSVNPGQPEVPNGFDDDCDGVIDEVVDPSEVCDFMVDRDNDGYPANFDRVDRACGAQPNYVSVDIVLAQGRGVDCVDTNASVNPGRTEVCNGRDDDCDQHIDDGVGMTFYVDGDGDGYGNSTRTEQACAIRAGLVTNANDCDDRNDDVHPDAPEVCNGASDDCDAQIDEGVQIPFFEDADGDTYGNPSRTASGCPGNAPRGHVGNDDDCNDGNAGIRPGATEVCDGDDNDCDGMNNEPGATGGSTWYLDADNDTYGHLTQTVVACTAPSGYIARTGDCSDLEATRYPGAPERCNGIDDNCNTVIDDNAVDRTTFYGDGDGDLFGNLNSPVLSCAITTGIVANSQDCDDQSRFIFPGAQEVCDGKDGDCDGVIDDGVKYRYFLDADADSFGGSTSTEACSVPSGYATNNDDCNDAIAAVNPNGTEACNGYDDDCDSVIDEAGATGGRTFYKDADGDAYGVPGTTTNACAVPTGYSDRSTDCNDNAATVNPGASERCNSVDDDCDQQIDENAVDMTVFSVDADGDSFGSQTATQASCTRTSGLVTNSTDCDDQSRYINPSATEFCDGIDNDCDLGVDEGVKSTFYLDADGDLFAGSATTQQACAPSSGYYAVATDCNDSNSAINPNAQERCDGADNDCDLQIDEAGATGGTTFYKDADADTYGVSGTTTIACSVPTGYSARANDCNDGEAGINPGASERCNGADDNCNGTADENAVDKTTFNVDSDGDSFGGTTTQASCTRTSGLVTNSTDCNDSRSDVYPGATEFCDGADQDCDGTVDEGVTITFYNDADGDSFAGSATTRQACTAPAGYYAQVRDCNDSNALINPSAQERCNGVDDNCDVQVDEDGAIGASTFYLDTDRDTYGVDVSTSNIRACAIRAGYAAVAGDCAPTNQSRHPNAPEVCNGVDDDCDSVVDENPLPSDPATIEWLQDRDEDGYGDEDRPSIFACDTMPEREIEYAPFDDDGNDCDDLKPLVHPGAVEVVGNGIDDDCDSRTPAPPALK